MTDRKIVLDVETTGLYPSQGHKIIEIACIELFDDEKVGEAMHLYINPQRDIPQEASNVHGITDSDVMDCPIFKDKYEEILAFIGDSKVIAHNSEFDRGFINYELKLINQNELPKEQFIDTLLIAKKKFPNQKVSLDELCKKFSIDLTSRKDYHGALIDIKLLAEVYYNLIKGQKSIFEDNSKTSVKTNIQTDEEEVLFYPDSYFKKRDLKLTDNEEQEHINFLKNMKKSIWLEKF